ncbi:L30e-like protein [Aspergillus candidus]|uniref:H/ACA ribonucleoprotein complex subunit 2 n=1 Tax=Aspergillus candidus TaxID=41067 RepID=A0A2I2F841_ASPCN|nr:L30e-like protein [Aspergillus candidus]PLB36797.1 L30e-like protein [Aspergillus candidus]
MDPVSLPTLSPTADPSLTEEILDVLQQAVQAQQAKKGVNETTKSVERELSEIVIVAADTFPIAIVMHLPMLCQMKKIACVFVPSKAELGEACGLGRSVIAATIIAGGEIAGEESGLAARIERLKEKIQDIGVE